jgi:hypothetical protein
VSRIVSPRPAQQNEKKLWFDLTMYPSPQAAPRLRPRLLRSASDHVFTFRDGKAVRMAEYAARASAFGAAGVSERMISQANVGSSGDFGLCRSPNYPFGSRHIRQSGGPSWAYRHSSTASKPLRS